MRDNPPSHLPARGGSHILAERRDIVSGKREKKRKKTNQRERRQRIPERRQGGDI
jgi:hypothetical protein